MEDQTPNYYGIIPADVRYDDKISDGAKLLYAEISALANKDGYCWATNGYFAALYKKHETTISRIINELLKQGHVRVEITSSKDGSKRKIYPLSKNAMGLSKNAKRAHSKNAKTPYSKNAKHNIITTNSNITTDINCPVFEKTELVTFSSASILKWQKPENVTEKLFDTLQQFATERQGRAKKERMTEKAWGIILKQAAKALNDYTEEQLIAHIESGIIGNWKSPFFLGWESKMPQKKAEQASEVQFENEEMESNYKKTIDWIVKRFEYIAESKVRQLSREEWKDLFWHDGQTFQQMKNYFSHKQVFSIFETLLQKLATDNYVKKSTLYSHLLKALKDEKANKIKQRS